MKPTIVLTLCLLSFAAAKGVGINQPSKICNESIQKCKDACASYKYDKPVGCCDVSRNTGNCYCCPLNWDNNCAHIQNIPGGCSFEGCDILGNFQGYPAKCPPTTLTNTTKGTLSPLDLFMNRL